jgi:hypothetical protein
MERFFSWRPAYGFGATNRAGTQHKEPSVTYRNLGRTGVQVSPICLGAMNFGGPTSEEDSVRIVDAAVDSGINFIDTANGRERAHRRPGAQAERPA